jgi:hypothetical protein
MSTLFGQSGQLVCPWCGGRSLQPTDDANQFCVDLRPPRLRRSEPANQRLHLGVCRAVFHGLGTYVDCGVDS